MAENVLKVEAVDLGTCRVGCKENTIIRDSLTESDGRSDFTDCLDL